MNYQEVIRYLDNAKVLGSVLGLSTMRALLAELGNPQAGLRAVHVAGTNGKGSTAAYLSEILQAAGHRTGQYISPFIQQFGERVQVDGVHITHDEIALQMTRVIDAAESITVRGCQQPTVFELITAMGFLHFKEKGCSIAVVEVGLGGRLDATNIIESPEVSVITHIGLDHTELLGETIPQIAAEKGGIIKPGCPVVLCAQEAEAVQTIEEICRSRGVPLNVADAGTARLRSMTVDGLLFDWDRYSGLRTRVTGLHQMSNAVTAVKTAQILEQKGWRIGEEAIRAGLRRTCCIGRMEALSEKPLFLVDGAHNPQGAEALTQSLDMLFPGKKFLFLVGMLADKDYRGVLRLAAPYAKKFYAVTPPVPRALRADVMAGAVRSLTDVPAVSCGGIEDAVKVALGEAGEDDILCAFGSLYQIGAIRAFFGLDRQEDWKE